MSTVIGSTRFGLAALFLAAGLINTGVSLPALATTTHTYKLYVYNSKLSGYEGLFGTATVKLNKPTSAFINFVSTPNSKYYFTDGGSVAVNVNGPFSLGTIGGTWGGQTYTTKKGKKKPIYSDIQSRQESSFGKFNQAIKSFDGFNYKSTNINFNLNRTSGTWTKASDVLTPNGTNGFYSVAAHIGVCNSVLVSDCTKFLATGYVADGSSSAEVPEPASLAVLGVGLLGLAWLSGRNRRRYRSHT